MRPMRALSYVGAALLLFGVSNACSSHSATVAEPAGPPALSITSISLGDGETGQGGDSSTLICDHSIGVTLAISNWQLLPPGICDQMLQCGQVRVSLLGSDGVEIGSPEFAATSSVDLKLDDLLDLSKLHTGASYSIEAQLVTDAGQVVNVTDGGNSAAQKAFFLSDILSSAADCAQLGVGGAPSSSEGGAAGLGGMPELGLAGALGEGGTAAGTGGTPG